MLDIHYLTFNPFGENTYIIFNENKEAAIIDAGNFFAEEDEQLFGFINQYQLSIKYILQTHCHIDHIMGLQKVCDKFNLKPTLHKKEMQMLQYAPQSAARFGFEFPAFVGDVEFAEENDIIKLGNEELQVIEVPGHSPGHICFYSKQQQFVISGDVLFLESVGRTDLPMCNHEDLMNSIKNKLFKLPNETKVFCGHGISTTIGYEKIHNPFVS